MLKGHTKIELTDVNTGKVKTIEKTNMFTNAIYKTLNNGWFQNSAGLHVLNNWYLPLCDRLMGGIVLFADTIDEDADNTNFPEENDVIGYAGTIASDGSSPLWGSRNILESTSYNPETKSVTHVWDFGTAQGNGRISAVGLTDGDDLNYYGLSAFNLSYGRYMNAAAPAFNYFQGCGVQIPEFNGDVFFDFANGTGKVTIKKMKFNFEGVGLNEKLGRTELLETHEVPLPNISMNYSSTCWEDGHDGYWYGFIACVNASFNSPRSTVSDQKFTGDRRTSYYIQVIRINKESYAMDYHNITTPQGYYSHPRTGFLVTKKYIAMPVSKSDYFYYYNQNEDSTSSVYIDRIAVISLQDWTCSIKNFEDSDGNLYSWFIQNSRAMVCQILVGRHQNFKLPNGLYQMNDLILNDDLVVVEQTKPYININTNLPETDKSLSGQKRYSSVPFRLGELSGSSITGFSSYHCVSQTINNEKCVMLVCYQHWDANNINNYWYLIPFDCQKLVTINNLQEPVTKTASQSMKITYTISEE